MNDPEFVALGTRCTAATILNINNVRKSAYPFDWADQPIESILNLVKIPHSTDDELKTYLDNYFNEVRSQRHPDGAWYPHDFTPTHIPEHQLDFIKEKYLRRFKRMFDLFESERDIVFLTVLSEYKEQNIVPFDRLSCYLYNATKCRKIFFITINVESYDICIGNWINLVVPFHGDWERFDADITAALKQNDITKIYFK